MELSLPYTWSDMTLGQLAKLEEATTDIDRVSALTGMEPDALRQAPAHLLSRASEHVKHLSQAESTRFERIWEHDGVRYGLVPDWTTFSIGEWIDLEGCTQDFWPSATRAMAILYRPVEWEGGGAYSIAKYTGMEDHSVFEKMPADVFSGAMLFFWATATKRQPSSTPCLTDLLRQGPAAWVRNGGGIMSFTRWLVRTFYGLMTSLRRAVTKSSSTLST